VTSSARDHHAHRLRLELFVRHLAVAVVQVGRVVLGFEVVGEGDALLAQHLQLFAPFGDQ
jgi:hypothetical protein